MSSDMTAWNIAFTSSFCNSDAFLVSEAESATDRERKYRSYLCFVRRWCCYRCGHWGSDGCDSSLDDLRLGWLNRRL